MYRPAWPLALIVVILGCGSSPAKVLVPKDPTPLAKCKVAKSAASPLVTEWPASEKAHLESMIDDRAVVVSYSGCEMRILDGCRVTGAYKWTRTTLAEDVIEIRDESELYAKVPLGAASLEGELETSGRLAIHITVAGQMRLDDEDALELPDSGGCKNATHVVSAISVGAFELRSGGAVSAGGGVNVGSAGVGAKHKSEETQVRAAGESEACQMTSSKAPDTDCASPLQVFLVPLEDTDDAEEPDEPVAKPTQPKRKQRWDEPPSDKSVEVHFALPDGGEDERWMLLSPEGDVLCKLPCVRRIGGKSGIQLQLDADRKEDIKVIAVPDDLGYTSGRRVRAVPEFTSSSKLVPGIGLGLTGAMTVGGFVMFAASGDQDQKGCEDNDDESLCTAGLAIAGVGLLGMLITGIWLGAAAGSDGGAGLDISLIEGENASLRLEPTGFVGSF